MGQTTKKNNLTHKKISKKKVQRAEDDDEYEIDEILIIENESEDTVFEIFDVTEKATFPGGEDELNTFIAENIKYPTKALENDKSGTVNVMFIVNKQGKVENIQILGKLKGYGLDDEAIRVIRLTSGMWKPAMQRDKPVNMRYRIPIAFHLY